MIKLQEESCKQFYKIADTSFQILAFNAQILIFCADRQREKIFNSHCPAPIYFAVTLAIATGRASESLMRPAVERHHRSSRALTQDAPTLRDLLIFEIARPGMFIWRRSCRREPPAPCPIPLSHPSSNLPADISQLLPPRARRGVPFFSPPMYPSSTASASSGLPFRRRRNDDDFRRRLKCQLGKTR